jgi:hypothetical protein
VEIGVKGGRYRSFRVSKWGDPDFRRLSPNARLLLLALSTGPTSSLAGIGHAYTQALVEETGLSAPEIEGAFGELEKLPTPARSFVMREGSVVWVRDQLADDPSRGDDPEIRNPKFLTAIETILGSLPRGSAVVKKFRIHYKLDPQRVSRTSSRTVSPTVVDSRIRIRIPNPNPETSPKTRPNPNDPVGSKLNLPEGRSNGHDSETAAKGTATAEPVKTHPDPLIESLFREMKGKDGALKGDDQTRDLPPQDKLDTLRATIRRRIDVDQNGRAEGLRDQLERSEYRNAVDRLRQGESFETLLVVAEQRVVDAPR